MRVLLSLSHAVRRTAPTVWTETTGKRRWSAQAWAAPSLAMLAGIGAVVAPMAASAAEETLIGRPVPPTPMARTESVEAWRSKILSTRKPSDGCFAATFPATSWQKVECRKPSGKLYPPKAAGGSHTDTVGGSGPDFSAKVTGHITQAEGAFDSVTGVTSEKDTGGTANAYTLQLNTDFFTTSTCSGAPDTACKGWEQFVFDSGGGGAIQYWLINWGPAGSLCPKPRGASCKANLVSTDGWCPQTVPGFTDVLCVVNAANAPAAAAEPITSLAQIKVTGTAGAGGAADDLTVTENGVAKSASGGNYFSDLGSQWQEAEFNIFGDGGSGGAAANLNTGSTIVVRTSVVSGTSNGPTCDKKSFTAESNNLTLVATSETPSTSGTPSLVFTESNAPGSTETACASAVSLGDTHVTTFDGLHYDFQASGDFVLLQDGSAFVVQARQASGAPNWPNASVNKAVAMRMGNTRVAIFIEPTKLEIDGIQRPLDDGKTLDAPGGVQVRRKGNLYIVSDESGDSVRATLNPTWIDLVVGLGHLPRTAARGLLGNPRGNGKALTTSRGVAMREPVAFNDLYHTYADSWRVPANETLFRETPAAKIGIPDKLFFSKDLAPEASARALQACKEAGVTNEDLLEDCKLDAAVLNDKVATRVFVRAPILRRVIRPVVLLQAP